MIKWLVLIAVVLLCGYIGYGLSNYYTSRSKFFKNLQLLFEKLKTEIRFSQNKLIEILSSFQTNSKDIKKLIKNFIDCLNFDKEINAQNLFDNIKILNDDEKNMLTSFFKTLGKFDAINQANQISSQQDELNLMFKSAEDEAKKFAPLYVKIGIIVGLVIALIFA